MDDATHDTKHPERQHQRQENETSARGQHEVALVGGLAKPIDNTKTSTALQSTPRTPKEHQKGNEVHSQNVVVSADAPEECSSPVQTASAVSSERSTSSALSQLAHHDVDDSSSATDSHDSRQPTADNDAKETNSPVPQRNTINHSASRDDDVVTPTKAHTMDDTNVSVQLQIRGSPPSTNTPDTKSEATPAKPTKTVTFHEDTNEQKSSTVSLPSGDIATANCTGMFST